MSRLLNSLPKYAEIRRTPPFLPLLRRFSIQYTRTWVRPGPLLVFPTTLCRQTMTTKRRVHSGSLGPQAAETREGALAIITQLMNQFNIDPAMLLVPKPGTGVSFSKVTYTKAAPLVGLNPRKKLDDIRTFEIHRSRIPTDIFKSIIVDMDVMFMQYGPPHQHTTEVARSRFFSPVFNHLVKQFGFMLRNIPETMLSGRIGTQGRIEYFFQTFGTVVVLCIEMKLELGNTIDERLKIIAQVIAECDGCDRWNSVLGFSPPIHCIFTDGLTYEFFKFEINSDPAFIRGCFLGDPVHLQRGLKVPDYSSMPTSLPFILQFRSVCETIFDLMLSAYIAGLKAYHVQLEEEERSRGLKRPGLDQWDKASQLADHALAAFREAEVQRGNGEFDSADATADRALLALRESTGAVPTLGRNHLIMRDWDDVEVRKA